MPSARKRSSRCREVFETLPDFRERSGRRYDLGTSLTLIFLAVLSGENGLREMARWMNEQRAELAQRFALARGEVPSYGTIRRILVGVDVNRLEQALTEWAQEAVVTHEGDEWEGIAIDGKKVRHSGDQGQPVLQLLSAFSHALSMVLAERAVKNKTNEIPEARRLLETLAVEGKVVTVDALHTQRQTAQVIFKKRRRTS